MLPYSASDRANRSSGQAAERGVENHAKSGVRISIGCLLKMALFCRTSGRRLRIREKGVACFALLCLERGSCVRTMVRPFEYGDGNLSRLMQMRLDAHRGIASLQSGPDSSVQSDGDGLTFAFNGG